MIQTAIYVGYTFPTGDDLEIQLNLKKIERISREILPNQFRLMADGKTENEYEAVFKVDLPLFDNDMERVRLFRSLKAIFDETIELEPYFCSYNAKAAEKARGEFGR